MCLVNMKICQANFDNVLTLCQDKILKLITSIYSGSHSIVRGTLEGRDNYVMHCME